MLLATATIHGVTRLAGGPEAGCRSTACAAYDAPIMRRISVVGCSGAGKTTLARKLAAALGAEHVELDSMFHQADWTPLDRDVFRARLGARLDAPVWVVDGNYHSQVQDLVWERADTIVWLDYDRFMILRSVFARTLRRIMTGEVLWNGNRERWANFFDPRPAENVILWSWTRHPKYRRQYAAKANDPAWADRTWIRLRTRAEAAEFLASLTATDVTSA